MQVRGSGQDGAWSLAGARNTALLDAPENDPRPLRDSNRERNGRGHALYRSGRQAGRER